VAPRALALLWVFSLALSGCASQDMAIRTLPPEEPGAAEAAAIEAATEAAAVPVPSASPEAAAEPPPPPVTPDDAPSMHTYDPWERLNRFTYRFNARFDEALFLPVANG
jgi:hypothetical protein